MSDPIVNGQKGAFIQPSEIGRDESGDYVILEFHGTRNEIKQQIPLIRASGGLYHVKDSFTGAATVITARFPYHTGAVEEPVDDWEIFGSRIEKDILEADEGDVNALTPREINIIRAAIANPDGDGNSSPAIDTLDGAAKAIYNLMLVGVKSNVFFGPVLRHTMSVSTLWETEFSIANVGRIITTATLLATETVPPLLVELPNYPDAKPNLRYGWLKGFPTRRVSLWKRVQLQQEWEYGLWAPVQYGDPL